MIHVLDTTQTLPVSADRAWDFFADPRNLSKITPPALDFTVLTPLPQRIHAGLMISYRVRPLLGIPVRWLTEITQVEPGKYFVDEQRLGPYKIWHHEHHFTPLGTHQTEIHDRVTYVLPFGPLGNLIHPLLVKPQLAKIFAYREKAVREHFA